MRPPASADWGVDREPGVDLGLVRVLHQVVEEAADLAHVARDLGHPLLGRVEFLQHHHGQEDVVFLEAEDGRGVVHQHVGVEDEEAGLVGLAMDHRVALGLVGQGVPGRIAGQMVGWVPGQGALVQPGRAEWRLAQLGPASAARAWAAARTSSTWPLTLTPRHSRRRRPARSNRKVLRSMPKDSRP